MMRRIYLLEDRIENNNSDGDTSFDYSSLYGNVFMIFVIFPSHGEAQRED